MDEDIVQGFFDNLPGIDEDFPQLPAGDLVVCS